MIAKPKEVEVMIKALSQYADTVLACRAIDCDPGYGIQQQRLYEHYTEQHAIAVDLIARISNESNEKGNGTNNSRS